MTNYLLAGGTDLIGDMISKKIMQSEEYIKGNARIIALVRSTSRFQEIYKGYDYRNVVLYEFDLCKNQFAKQLGEPIDYIIHCAAPTASSYMISNPVETADCIVLGTRNVLELARQKKIKSMVYLSSMEVYGQVADRKLNRVQGMGTG